jgi:hypothetical protein
LSSLGSRGSARRRRVLLLLTVSLLLLTAVATLLLTRLTITLLLLAELLLAGNLRRSLFVLGVVAGINGTENELQDPKIRGEIDGRVGASHLCGLVLVVGRAVDHAANGRVVVKLAKELSG